MPKDRQRKDSALEAPDHRTLHILPLRQFIYGRIFAPRCSSHSKCQDKALLHRRKGNVLFASKRRDGEKKEKSAEPNLTS